MSCPNTFVLATEALTPEQRNALCGLVQRQQGLGTLNPCGTTPEGATVFEATGTVSELANAAAFMAGMNAELRGAGGGVVGSDAAAATAV